MAKLISEGTIELDRGVSVYSCAAAVGKMESDGPLGNCFDYAAEGAELGLTTWEKAESTFQQYAFDIALRKGKLIKEDISPGMERRIERGKQRPVTGPAGPTSSSSRVAQRQRQPRFSFRITRQTVTTRPTSERPPRQWFPF